MEDDMCLDPLREDNRRKEDRSTLAWLSSITIKYHWLVTTLFAIFLVLGFDFKTPAAAFAEIRSLITKDRIVDSLAILEINERNKQADKDRAEMRNLVEGLVIMQCRRNLPLSQDNRLPCRRLYREWGLE